MLRQQFLDSNFYCNQGEIWLDHTYLDHSGQMFQDIYSTKFYELRVVKEGNGTEQVYLIQGSKPGTSFPASEQSADFLNHLKPANFDDIQKAGIVFS